MNLIKDPWLPIARQNGTREKISIRQLLDYYRNNPVVELEVHRPAFRKG